MLSIILMVLFVVAAAVGVREKMLLIDGRRHEENLEWFLEETIAYDKGLLEENGRLIAEIANLYEENRILEEEVEDLHFRNGIKYKNIKGLNKTIRMYEEEIVDLNATVFNQAGMLDNLNEHAEELEAKASDHYYNLQIYKAKNESLLNWLEVMKQEVEETHRALNDKCEALDQMEVSMVSKEVEICSLVNLVKMYRDENNELAYRLEQTEEVLEALQKLHELCEQQHEDLKYPSFQIGIDY